jgi:hypothetical protein
MGGVIEITALSEAVLAESIKYLGPAAKKFLERQTKSHLGGIEFDTLSRSQIPELAKWVHASAAIVIDKSKAAELAEKIIKLG